MRCRRAERLISVALDGELDQARRENLRGHLASCDRCRALAASLEVWTGTLGSWEAPEPRVGFTGRTMARTTSPQAGRARWHGWLEYLRPAPLGLGAAAFCFGVVLTVLANGEPAPQASPSEPGIEGLATDYLGEPAEDSVETGLLALLPETEE